MGVQLIQFLINFTVDSVVDDIAHHIFLSSLNRQNELNVFLISRSNLEFQLFYPVCEMQLRKRLLPFAKISLIKIDITLRQNV